MSKKHAITQLTVVVPAYNAADWLKKSIPTTIRAIQKANIKKAEILVIDDGSTDNTVASVKKIKSIFPIRVISQANSGRFVARETGTNHAKYDLILFIDSRVFIGEDSLCYVLPKINLNDTKNRVWNAHVHINRDSIYARFWEAITFNVWRGYFHKPRHISYTIKDFDKYPKGTTCMLVSKQVMSDANTWFRTQTRDLKTSNDDTLLLRGIARHNNINISPEYNCAYNSRTSLKQYTKHVFHRGKVFVDGFMRNDGNAYYYPLIAFLVLSASIIPFFMFFPELIFPVLSIGLLMWPLLALLMILRKTEFADTLSFFILFPVFLFSYGAGIWTMFLKQVVHQFNAKELNEDRLQ